MPSEMMHVIPRLRRGEPENKGNAVLPIWFLPRGAAHIFAQRKKVIAMFLTLAIILFVIWIGVFLLFKTAGFVIHLILLFAIVSVIMHFISGKRAV